MRVQYCRGIFWMELRANVPLQRWNLDYLNEVRIGIDAHTPHASLLVFLLILVVELIAMAVTFADNQFFTFHF